MTAVLLAASLVVGSSIVVFRSGPLAVGRTQRWAISSSPGVASVAGEEVASAEIAWIRQFGTRANETAVAVAADSAGNVYVVGQGVGFFVNNCGTKWSGEGIPAGPKILRKFDAAGNAMWTREDYASALAADSTGVFLATSNSVWKYDADGTLRWRRQISESGLLASRAIAVDGSGVYLVGNTSGRDAFVVRLDVDGEVLWISEFTTPVDDWAEAIALDSSGMFIAGSIDGGPSGFLRRVDHDGVEAWTRVVETSLTPSGRWIAGVDPSAAYVASYTLGSSVTRIFTQKYDLDGDLIWTREFNGSSGRPIAAALIDGTGIYAAGIDEFHECGDAFVQRYAFDGNEVWSRHFSVTNRFSTEQSTAVVVLGGTVYVAGWTNGGLWGSLDGFVAKLVTANVPPNLAEIASAPVVAVTGQDVTFTAAVTDADGDSLTYTWNFGDGATMMGTTAPGGGTITATHAYSAGTFTVTLSVNDGQGGMAAKSVTLRVVPLLSLDLSAEPISGTAPLTISFFGIASGGLPPYSFKWDFGDGSLGTVEDPTHTYEIAGGYTIALTVTDADGRATTKTVDVIVRLPEGPPWGLYALAGAVAGGIAGMALWRWQSRVRKPPPPRAH